MAKTSFPLVLIVSRLRKNSKCVPTGKQKLSITSWELKNAINGTEAKKAASFGADALSMFDIESNQNDSQPE